MQQNNVADVHALLARITERQVEIEKAIENDEVGSGQILLLAADLAERPAGIKQFQTLTTVFAQWEKRHPKESHAR